MKETGNLVSLRLTKMAIEIEFLPLTWERWLTSSSMQKNMCQVTLGARRIHQTKKTRPTILINVCNDNCAENGLHQTRIEFVFNLNSGCCRCIDAELLFHSTRIETG
jgi:hypothetical protein